MKRYLCNGYTTSAAAAAAERRLSITRNKRGVCLHFAAPYIAPANRRNFGRFTYAQREREREGQSGAFKRRPSRRYCEVRDQSLACDHSHSGPRDCGKSSSLCARQGVRPAATKPETRARPLSAAPPPRERERGGVIRDTLAEDRSVANNNTCNLALAKINTPIELGITPSEVNRAESEYALGRVGRNFAFELICSRKYFITNATLPLALQSLSFSREFG